MSPRTTLQLHSSVTSLFGAALPALVVDIKVPVTIAGVIHAPGSPCVEGVKVRWVTTEQAGRMGCRPCDSCRNGGDSC